MYFKTKNNLLVVYIDFLQGLKLKAKASRGRSKLVDLLNQKNNELQKDVVELQRHFFKTDKNDKFQTDDDNKLILKNGFKLDDAQKDLNELYSEIVSIDLNEYADRFKSLYNALNNYEYDFEGKKAIVYDNLMDKLEEAFNEGPKKPQII